jgi:hypothetical protein
MFLSEVSQVQQAYEPIRVRVLFDPALIAVLDAYRREAAGIPSGSEVEAVRPIYAELGGSIAAGTCCGARSLSPLWISNRGRGDCCAVVLARNGTQR